MSTPEINKNEEDGISGRIIRIHNSIPTWIYCVIAFIVGLILGSIQA